MVAQRHGKIILTTSVSGLFGLRGQATYAAAKCAVVGLMRILAIEGAEHGILVNTISPTAYTRMHPAAGSRTPEAEGRRTMPVEVTGAIYGWRGAPCSLDSGASPAGHFRGTLRLDQGTKWRGGRRLFSEGPPLLPLEAPQRLNVPREVLLPPSLRQPGEQLNGWWGGCAGRRSYTSRSSGSGDARSPFRS